VTARASSSGAGLPATIQSKTATYTAAAGEFVKADATSAGFTVTLPSNPTTGALVTVKKTDGTANVVTVAPQGGGTIDGDSDATIITPQFGAVFEHVGSNVWEIVAPTSAGGTNGVDGADGNTVRSGAGAPSSGLGADGDFYIDTTSLRIYGPKTAGAWGSYTSLTGGGSIEYPWRVEINPATASGYTNWSTVSYAAVVGAVARISVGSQNNEVYWDIVLGAGTWTVSLVHTAGNDKGIYSVQLDGVEVGTIDGYNASTVNNTISAVTGIVVASTGVKRLKLRMETKNASSSSYYGTIQVLSLQRTA
jgi:hypothetical protein